MNLTLMLTRRHINQCKLACKSFKLEMHGDICRSHWCAFMALVFCRNNIASNTQLSHPVMAFSSELSILLLKQHNKSSHLPFVSPKNIFQFLMGPKLYGFLKTYKKDQEICHSIATDVETRNSSRECFNQDDPCGSESGYPPSPPW